MSNEHSKQGDSGQTRGSEPAGPEQSYEPSAAKPASPGIRPLIKSQPAQALAQRRSLVSRIPPREVPAGAIQDWTNAVFRPDLYKQPALRNSPDNRGHADAAQALPITGSSQPAQAASSATEFKVPATSTPMMAGLKPGVSPGQTDEMLGGGRTMDEAIGDTGRVVGTELGNVVGSVAGALTGISISSTTNTGPAWRDHGNFEWVVGFSTTGQSGWIVQEVVNTYRAQDATGNDLGGTRPTAKYWEAWAVDATSNITPNVGANHDYWLRPGRGNNTQGHWSMEGKVYFTTTDPATQGFSPGGAPDAGILLSTTSAPSGLGVARLHRYAQGTWDSTGTAPIHTGSAA